MSHPREVTILGPGTGECVVIHLGNDQWFIVDSFIDPETKQPAALSYLDERGIPTQNVMGVLATHFHCDHIRGLDHIISCCENACFFFPAALTNPEAVVYYQTNKDATSFGTRAFTETILTILEHMKGRERRFRSLEVQEGTGLFADPQTQTRLTALSPSSEAVRQMIESLMVPQQGDRRKVNALPSDPNLNAVALHLEFGDHVTFLLGSDLEVTNSDRTGWNAILTSGLAQRLSLSKATVYKVPHHGSSTGHSDAIWQHLIEPLPISMTTCFARHRLPREEQISQITEASSEFYLTTQPICKPERRSKAVEKLMNAHSRNRHSVRKKTGRITIQLDEHGVPNVTLRPPAYQV